MTDSLRGITELERIDILDAAIRLYQPELRAKRTNAGEILKAYEKEIAAMGGDMTFAISSGVKQDAMGCSVSEKVDDLPSPANPSEISETASIGVTKEPRAESVNSEQQGSVSAKAPTGLTHAPSDIQSGISGLDDATLTELHDEMSLLLLNSENDSHQEDVTEILELMKPYLRTTEPKYKDKCPNGCPLCTLKPVSVSLSDVMNTAYKATMLDAEDLKAVIKCAYDAAGVNYD